MAAPSAPAAEDAPERLQLPGRRTAAPSWVMPGPLAENCRFLAGRVDEVGLLFFETRACLAYGPSDLPPWLASLPLCYHIHLPTDLPMNAPEKAARICCRLMEKAAFLSPGAAVLHPPSGPDAASRLGDFLEAWQGAGQKNNSLLLENTGTCDLLSLADRIFEHDLGICLDMGHMLAFGHQRLLDEPELLARVRMLHANAPAPGEGRHLPLGALSGSGQRDAQRLCRSIPPTATAMLELFDWDMISASFPLLRQWLGAAGPDAFGGRNDPRGG